jgi:hypothetical protein
MLHEVQARWRPDALLLLGSWAEDSVWQESDVDLLLLCFEPPAQNSAECLYGDTQISVSFMSFERAMRLAKTAPSPNMFGLGTPIRALRGAQVLKDTEMLDAHRVLSMLAHNIPKLAPGMMMYFAASSLADLRGVRKAASAADHADAALLASSALDNAARAYCWMKAKPPGRQVLREVGLDKGAVWSPGYALTLAQELLEEPLGSIESIFRSNLAGFTEPFSAVSMSSAFAEMDGRAIWDNLFSQMVKRGVLRQRHIGEGGLSDVLYELTDPDSVNRG